VNPALPLVDELVRRGHRVTYATRDKFKPAIEAAGATVFPTHGTFLMQPPKPGFGPEQLAERMAMFIEMIRTDFPRLLAHAQQDPPDAVCYGALAGIGGMLAEKLRVPDIALVPTFASNEHFSLRTQFVSSGLDPANNRNSQCCGTPRCSSHTPA
jgi:UDP:flavonoid glycosyltransferase YjiC (YdhE family)